MNDLKAIKAIPKNGNEQFTFNGKATDFTLIDFWKWSVSDILSNATRGRLAEFIVGSAIGLSPDNLRNEWDAFDLTTEKGIKIEVKSAAFIQSWNQKQYSKISFSIKAAKYWDAETNMQKGEQARHADVYVFCLLNHKDQSTIDPLKLDQWEFFILPTYLIDNYERSKTSITLNSLLKITKSITYDDLKTEIEKAFELQIESKPK